MLEVSVAVKLETLAGRILILILNLTRSMLSVFLIQLRKNLLLNRISLLINIDRSRSYLFLKRFWSDWVIVQLGLVRMLESFLRELLLQR